MAATTADLVSIADSLPINLKIELIDKLLESISSTEGEIDELWKAEVERRIDEVEGGAVKTIPGDEVFARIRQQFGR
jgi:putative addiction module component (TIGR02574 family)